jgi:hypothetical protein
MQVSVGPMGAHRPACAHTGAICHKPMDRSLLTDIAEPAHMVNRATQPAHLARRLSSCAAG